MYDELAAAQQRVTHAVQQVRARGRCDGGGGGSDLIQWDTGGYGRARYSKGGGGSGRPTRPTGEGISGGGRALLLAGLMVTKGGGTRKGKRKRSSTTPQVEELLATISKHIANAYAEGSKRVIKSALTAFSDFEEAYPERQALIEPEYAGDPVAALNNEMSLMMFAAWMVHQGLAMSTVSTYLSLTKTNLSVTFGWALTCKEMEMRLPRMLKGMRRTHRRLRKKRLGWRALYERKLQAAKGAPKGREQWSEAAVRRTLRQGLLRGADCLPNTAAGFDTEVHSTTADVEHFDAPQPHYKLTVLPAKKSEQQAKSEIVLLPKGDGVTDAYTALAHIIGKRGIGERGSDEPLFVHDDGEPWLIGEVRALFKRSGAAIGIKQSELGAQSGRIGGATDMFAQGATPAMLQMSGRWDSVSRNSNPGRTRTHVAAESQHAHHAIPYFSPRKGQSAAHEPERQRQHEMQTNAREAGARPHEISFPPPTRAHTGHLGNIHTHLHRAGAGDITRSGTERGPRHRGHRERVRPGGETGAAALSDDKGRGRRRGV